MKVSHKDCAVLTLYIYIYIYTYLCLPYNYCTASPVITYFKQFLGFVRDVTVALSFETLICSQILRPDPPKAGRSARRLKASRGTATVQILHVRSTEPFNNSADFRTGLPRLTESSGTPSLKVPG